MSRPVTTLVVFFLAFQLLAALFVGTGVAAMLELETGAGQTDACKAWENECGTQSGSEVPTGSTSGGTLFGMYTVMGDFLSNIYGFVFPGLAMLNNAGVPGYITYGFLGNMFTLLIVIDVAAFVRGYNI